MKQKKKKNERFKKKRIRKIAYFCKYVCITQHTKTHTPPLPPHKIEEKKT